MLIIKTVLAKILMTYRILPTIPAHKPIIAAETVAKPANGVRVRIEEL